jgi:tetrahydromethanopterin S-methyltransferase subunit G
MEQQKTPVTLETLADSIDALARITSAGFDQVNHRLDKVEHRLDKVESRLDVMENRLEKVETEMKGLRYSIDRAMELSDARYLELRQQNKELYKCLLQVIQAAKLNISTEDLEKRFALL